MRVSGENNDLNKANNFQPLVRIAESNELYDWSLTDHLIELSECPCDPRRRDERFQRRVAVV